MTAEVGASGATEIVAVPVDEVRVGPDAVGSARGGGVEVQAAPTRRNANTTMPNRGRASAGIDTGAR